MNSHTKSPIRLLLVDDHEIVRIGLRTVIERFEGIRVIAEADSVATALDAIARHQPDLVLLDVRLRDESGFEVCKQLSTIAPNTHVLILTSFADDETIFQAIDAGADGYLLKEIDCATLEQAIRDVAAGKSILDPTVTKRVLSHMRTPNEPNAKAKFGLLAPQERRVLAQVAEGKTNKEIASSLALSEKTVKNYLSNIFTKLSMTRRAQAAAFFVQNSPDQTT